MTQIATDVEALFNAELMKPLLLLLSTNNIHYQGSHSCGKIVKHTRLWKVNENRSWNVDCVPQLMQL
jgi:hypothetical protein